MTESHKPGLLINIGGTPAPVAFAIDHYRPEKVIFFASRSSRTEIETKVRPLAKYAWIDQEIITTSDFQDLTTCLEILSRELPRCLDNLGLEPEQLRVDYTGGTKTMSAALVLGTIDLPVEYSYVGGKIRTKEGLGTVLDGSEALLLNPNPWDTLALDLKRRMARQFSQARFAEARQTAELAMQRVSPDHKGLFEDFRALFDAYLRWSLFDYTKVEGPLRKATAGLLRAGEPSLSGFLNQVEADTARLGLIVPAFKAMQRGSDGDPEGIRALLVDLVINAVRTVRLASRPDDGVARLYSAIEKFAKSALKTRGIDNSHSDPEQIPEALRDDFQHRFRNPADDTLRFGLDASYRLLAALEDPLGQVYIQHEKELSQLLNVRNGSLMVHGWSPVSEAVFDRMLAIALEFLCMAEDELPALPELRFDSC